MRKKELQIVLSRLKEIDYKIKFEQYPTPPDVAARILWEAYIRGDIEGRKVVDFGTGNGILAIGAKLLGAKEVLGIDIDEDCIRIARENAEELGLEIRFERMDVEDFSEKVDTVLMNPPFGLKRRGEDRKFLRKAFEVGDVVYCIHKIESDTFFKKFSEEYGFSSEMLFEFYYRLPPIYKFHESKSYYFRAGVWRFERKGLEGP